MENVVDFIGFEAWPADKLVAKAIDTIGDEGTPGSRLGVACGMHMAIGLFRGLMLRKISPELIENILDEWEDACHVAANKEKIAMGMEDRVYYTNSKVDHEKIIG